MQGKEIVDKSGEDVGKGSGQMVGGRYHAALWCDHSTSYIRYYCCFMEKDVRFTSERHLRYIVRGQKY